MSLLLESIKVHKNKIFAWKYHEQRIERSLHVCYDKDYDNLISIDSLQKYVDQLDDKLYKLRIIYDDHYYKIEHHLYKIKPINSLKLIYDDNISYSEKYADRESLNKLYAQKETADDILIIKNGLITDTHYCNVALLKEGRWYTPAKPLLCGVKRQELLDVNVIEARDILAKDIKSYTHIRLFNAMVEFGEVELTKGCVLKL